MTRYLFALVFFALSFTASAGEIGNIFSPKNSEIDKQSRAASATALQGVQSIIVALEHSELRQLDDRRASLATASKVLNEAVAQMKAVSISDDVNVQLAWAKLNERDRGYVLYVRTTYLGEKDLPKKVKDLYYDLIALTTILSASVGKAAETNDPILPRNIVLETARFLDFANVVSEAITVSNNN
jgi:hypothetical protein